MLELGIVVSDAITYVRRSAFSIFGKGARTSFDLLAVTPLVAAHVTLLRESRSELVIRGCMRGAPLSRRKSFAFELNLESFLRCRRQLGSCPQPRANPNVLSDVSFSLSAAEGGYVWANHLRAPPRWTSSSKALDYWQSERCGPIDTPLTSSTTSMIAFAERLHLI